MRKELEELSKKINEIVKTLEAREKYFERKYQSSNKLWDEGVSWGQMLAYNDVKKMLQGDDDN